MIILKIQNKISFLTSFQEHYKGQMTFFYKYMYQKDK